jgi:hypothetical protein
MDEGLPIAYLLLDEGVPVLASGGEVVGTVEHVVAAPDEDIFHGVVMSTSGHGRRFVEASKVASLHERGVDLSIDADAIESLPAPHGRAAEFREDPTETKWEHIFRKVSLRKDWKQER